MYDFYDGVKQWAFYIVYGNNICDTVHCSHATWNLFVLINTLKRVLLSIKVAGCFGGQMTSSCTKQRGGEGGTSGPEQQGWVG